MKKLLTLLLLSPLAFAEIRVIESWDEIVDLGIPVGKDKNIKRIDIIKHSKVCVDGYIFYNTFGYGLLKSYGKSTLTGKTGNTSVQVFISSNNHGSVPARC